MTTPTQIRLTDEDKAGFEEIRKWYGLPSIAAAVRMAGEIARRLGPPGVPGTTPKRRKAR